MNLERMWHVKLFYNRNPNITEEEFNRHWAYEHPKVVGDLYMKHGYVRYSQVSPPLFVGQVVQEQWMLMFVGTNSFTARRNIEMFPTSEYRS